MDALSLRGKIGESDRFEPPSRSARIRRKTDGRPRFENRNRAGPRTTGPSPSPNIRWQKPRLGQISPGDYRTLRWMLHFRQELRGNPIRRRLVSEGASEASLSAWKGLQERNGTGQVLVRTARCRAARRIVAQLAPAIPGCRGDSHRRKSRGIVAVDHFGGEQRNTDLSCWALTDHRNW